MSAVIVIWLILGAVGAAIGYKKGKPWQGLALGIILGIFGVIIMIFVRPDRDYLLKQEKARLDIEAEARRWSEYDRPTETFRAHRD